MLRHHRGNRITTTKNKAKRKIRIIHETWGRNDNNLDDWLVFGVYRKGKVHCSCPMCASKTNAKNNKSRGPVFNTSVNKKTGLPIYGKHGTRLTCTNQRYGKKNYTASDRKKIDSMIEQENEYNAKQDIATLY